MSLQLSAPQPLLPTHDVTRFSCGQPILDDWLKRRALSNHLSGASRVFVTTDALGRVYGYYALAAGAVAHVEAPGRIKRNMPDPIPVIVLGRLARDLDAKHLQLGGSLLQDAVTRASGIAQTLGVRALLTHAIDAKAATFYAAYGFMPSPMDPHTLLLRLG